MGNLHFVISIAPGVMAQLLYDRLSIYKDSRNIDIAYHCSGLSLGIKISIRALSNLTMARKLGVAIIGGTGYGAGGGGYGNGSSSQFAVGGAKAPRRNR